MVKFLYYFNDQKGLWLSSFVNLMFIRIHIKRRLLHMDHITSRRGEFDEMLHFDNCCAFHSEFQEILSGSYTCGDKGDCPGLDKGPWDDSCILKVFL